MPAHQAVYLLSLHHIKTIQMTDTHALYLLSSCTNHVPTPRYYTHGLPHLASMVLHGVVWGESVSKVAILKKAALRILEPAT